MQTEVDHTIPGEKWKFDESVTSVFNNMLERSIPQYEVMRKLVFDIACKYRKPKTDIVDLGCSRGESLAKLIDKYGSQNHFIGIDVSKPMLEECSNRFSGLINCGVVNINNIDLRNDYPLSQSSVTMSVFTLQFVPIEYRLKVLSNIYKNIIPGGVFIFVEKVLGSSAEIDDVMVDIYYKMKSDNGYSEEEITRKKLSLEGVLVPVTAKWNEELLRMSGFNQVDCFWRWMNFAGWIGIK